MLLLETCNEVEDFYNVFLLSQNTFHTLQTKKKLMGSPKSYSLHKHSCIEIMYVISGEVTNHVENQIYTYKAGQFCVMNKNIYHCEEFTGNFQAIFFMLRDDFMLDLLKEYYDQNSGSSTPIEMNLIYHLIEDSQHSTRKFDKEYLDYFPVLPSHDTLTLIESIIHFIIQELQYPQTGSSFFIKGTFARMFQSMNDPSHYISNRIRSDSTSQEFLFKKITHIIRSNHGRCTRESLAAQLHYNGE